ncbi:MAG TPA: BMP family ABC transporter substrate-binding protein [Clostridia bacterium]|nr:BMP family ABC transporter substrate-binding protein [Clostridia bacterium]HRX41752.1 BMP family ABC transporter substrate-binding protein [Clostridia bacterium]
MKKFLAILLAVAMVATLFVGCKGSEPTVELKKEVGMVTDAGTIDDKSFNQGTWEGVVEASADLGYEPKYLKPAGTTDADYMTEITNLVDSGYKLIVCPGFKFEATIFAAQDKYPDVKFVLIDGTPHSADYSEFRQEANVVSIFFAEEQSGFLAGVAAAVEKPDAEFGFIGGMEIPAVQKFNWGFQQGLKYANANLGTNTTINAENVVYQGSFDDVAAGTALAAQMYDKGVDVIFAAAGGVGVGVITEAKNRAVSGEDVWVVGVDVDQYPDGVYEGSKSVILTSAMKSIGVAAYDMVKAYDEGTFPGGETLIFDASNNGVQIPDENPNLSAAAYDAYEAARAGLVDGSIVVAAVQGDLIK